ncbi:hypothetical protein LI951_14065 [Enterococcus sp. BWT-B8]|uniref:hypothetical protein n=1 Tax=Enterococcus sp. BWT-B8 TaxID=2885157 RepID=UPI001E36C030|nr:hypothetical protein [Enterococcus sp. BWT-B8]MCB5953198.1 hypothetical protein [Enterococcus sp. BWT-B8]
MKINKEKIRKLFSYFENVKFSSIKEIKLAFESCTTLCIQAITDKISNSIVIIYSDESRDQVYYSLTEGKYVLINDEKCTAEKTLLLLSKHGENDRAIPSFLPN